MPLRGVSTRPSIQSSCSVCPALQGAGGASGAGVLSQLSPGQWRGFALNKLPVGRAVSLGAIKMVKLFPYPLSHSGAALLFPLLWHSGLHGSGRQRVLVSRVCVPGHPGESVVVHWQVSLLGGLPAQQDRQRDPASRRPAEEQRQTNQNKVKTEMTLMNQQQSLFLTQSLMLTIFQVRQMHHFIVSSCLLCWSAAQVTICYNGAISNWRLWLSYFKVLLGRCSWSKMLSELPVTLFAIKNTNSAMKSTLNCAILIMTVHFTTREDWLSAFICLQPF